LKIISKNDIDAKGAADLGECVSKLSNLDILNINFW
jgi:hypothetical protein